MVSNQATKGTDEARRAASFLAGIQWETYSCKKSSSLGLDKWATTYHSVCTNGNNRGTSLDTDKLPAQLWMREMKVVLSRDDVVRILCEYVDEHHNDTTNALDEEHITFHNSEGIHIPIQSVEIPILDPQ